MHQEMPTSVSSLFAEFKIQRFNHVKWGTTFNDDNEGIYVVSASDDVNLWSVPDFDDRALQLWIDKLPDFTIDNQQPSIESLKGRLHEFWLPDENILYIGKAPKRTNFKGLSTRVKEYYRTEIGNGSPHSGGQWIKTLRNLASTNVFYAAVENSSEIEERMLYYFMENVSPQTLNGLRDRNLPLPFANLKYGNKKSKVHGLKKQRVPRPV